MSHDHQLRRLTEKMKTLTDDQKRVNQRILQSRRDEQFELEHIRRRFSAEIHGLEERQRKIVKDVERYERELVALQDRIKKEEQEADEDSTREPKNLRPRRF